MASLLRRNIQDFVQEVPAGQMAQGFGACRGPTLPRPDLKVLGGGKGEVKPPRVGGSSSSTYTNTCVYGCARCVLAPPHHHHHRHHHRG